jgi:hypothetical protein
MTEQRELLCTLSAQIIAIDVIHLETKSSLTDITATRILIFSSNMCPRRNRD